MNIGKIFNDEYYDYKFSEEEKKKLRPIAETLAMLDGNAFFGVKLDNDTEHYEQYLPEAKQLVEANGGYDSWFSEVSWMKKRKKK